MTSTSQSTRRDQGESKVEVEREAAVATVWMNSPDRHNAFDEALIAELTETLLSLEADEDVRVVVLAGRGRSFSAGADLNWMKRLGAASQEENLEDARRLGRLFRVLSGMRKPTVARVHGAAMGGGMGLAAACDIVVASAKAVFATSEARLGIIPSAIGPYVLRAIGERQCYRYFQTGERISARRAHEIGLVHELVDAPRDDGAQGDGAQGDGARGDAQRSSDILANDLERALDVRVDSMVAELLACSPAAQAAATDLIRALANRPIDDALVEDTARRIASIRATGEAREGLAAFLEKRKPAWLPASTSSDRAS